MTSPPKKDRLSRHPQIHPHPPPPQNSSITSPTPPPAACHMPLSSAITPSSISMSFPKDNRSEIFSSSATLSTFQKQNFAPIPQAAFREIGSVRQPSTLPRPFQPEPTTHFKAAVFEPVVWRFPSWPCPAAWPESHSLRLIWILVFSVTIHLILIVRSAGVRPPYSWSPSASVLSFPQRNR